MYSLTFIAIGCCRGHAGRYPESSAGPGRNYLGPDRHTVHLDRGVLALWPMAWNSYTSKITTLFMIISDLLKELWVKNKNRMIHYSIQFFAGITKRQGCVRACGIFVMILIRHWSNIESAEVGALLLPNLCDNIVVSQFCLTKGVHCSLFS